MQKSTQRDRPGRHRRPQRHGTGDAAGQAGERGQHDGGDQVGEQVPQPLPAFVGGVLAAGARWPYRNGAAGEAMGEPLVGPPDHLGAEGDRHSDVDGGEAVRGVGDTAVPEVDHRRGQQHHVHQWYGEQHDRAEPPGP
jgi:hypothetical protein